jgi:Spy/CpxP family protein refolding chaperone
MNKILTTLFTLMAFLSAYAQPMDSKMKSKIENIKIGVITQAVDLTPAQAQQFWPIYNKYSQDLKSIRKDFKESIQMSRAEDATEAQMQQVLTQLSTAKQQELDLQKKYQADFLRVISPKQLLDLYAAEKRFNAELARRIMEKRKGGVKNGGGMRRPGGGRGMQGSINRLPIPSVENN